MMSLTDVETVVESEAHFKKDLFIDMNTLIPGMSEGVPYLTTGKMKRFEFTDLGLDSYLTNIKVPRKFFDTCSDDLKLDIMQEFHEDKFLNNSKPTKRLRLYGESIRFVASTQYRPYDDIEVVKALKGHNFDLGFEKTVFEDGYTLLRSVDPRPIEIDGHGTFFAGLSITNSEVGRASLSVEFYIHEQVCSNGLRVPRLSNRYRVTHRVSPDQMKERFLVEVDQRISQFADFSLNAENLLNKLATTPAGMVKDRLLSFDKIPVKVRNDVVSKVDQDKSMTALNVVHQLTAYARDLEVNARIEAESIAGALVA